MLQITTGQTLGSYRVLNFLGRGAFALVFLAESPSGEMVALKMGDESGGGQYLPRFGEVTGERNPSGVSPDETPAEALFLDPREGAKAEVLDSHEVDELLRNEAEILKSADGRGLPKLLEVFELDTRPVLVMEYIEGSTLREKIRSLEGIKLGWLVEVSRTLERLQGLGWECHGDVKPENIMVTLDERVILLDPMPSATRSDEILATPWYNPFLRHDSKGDTHSLAILLYELLCGCLPFDEAPFRYAGMPESACSEEDLSLALSMYLAYPKPREVNAHAPRELERIIYRSLCDEAYGLADFRLDLEDFLAKV
jgi:serine/threonine protein kinase